MKLQGKRNYESVPIELTIADIMEQVDGDPFTALLIAETMVANTNEEIERLKGKTERNTQRRLLPIGTT